MIVGLLRPGGWQGATARPGKTLGVMSFALFFLVVGWFIAVHRMRLVLDPATCEVALVNDFFPFRRKRTHRLEHFRPAVPTTRRTAVTAKSRSELVCLVRLVRPDKDSESTVSVYSVADASTRGNKIAGMFESELIEMSESQWGRFST